MHQSAIDAFPSFSVPLEGEVASMYCDVLGLITIAVGCLIDPVGLAIGLPFKHETTGQLATPGEIAAAWNALKSQKDKYSKLHWRYAAQLNDLRLDQQGIDELVRERMLLSEKVLRGYFPNWDLIPADGQLCCMSMAWAMGPGFPHTFGNFRAAVLAQDWTSALTSCLMRTSGNAGIVPRNAANQLCCANAAAVIAQGLDPAVLHWPANVPNASQRDQALRLEAQLALADHVDNYGSSAGRDVADQNNPEQGSPVS